MKREEWLRYSIIALAVIGLLLSLYLLKTHYEPPQKRFCDVNATFSCDFVNHSEYAELLGIPVSLLGLLHYALLLFVALFPLWLAKLCKLELRLLYLLLLFELSLGLLFSIYLTGVEAFILHAYCPLCLLSAAITLAHFILAILLWKDTPFSAK
jgi:uncharacterized membrane protein